jgi:hypothetical protein
LIVALLPQPPLRISAQLIDASTDQHLWSQNFDRSLTTANPFAIQDEIATAIVARLTPTIGAMMSVGKPIAVKAGTADVDVYDLYLKGRSLFIARTKDNLSQAVRGKGSRAGNYSPWRGHSARRGDERPACPYL